MHVKIMRILFDVYDVTLILYWN